MGNRSLNKIMEELRAELTVMLGSAGISFARIASFTDEANQLLGELFVGGAGSGVVWFNLYRSDTERDHYALDFTGKVRRERHVSKYTESWDDWDTEVLGCTAEEFAGAMTKRLATAMQDQKSQTAAIAQLSGRICKPIIEVCLRSMDNDRAAARLASQTGIWERGDDVYKAVDALLASLSGRGLPAKIDSYTVVLLRRQAF